MTANHSHYRTGQRVVRKCLLTLLGCAIGCFAAASRAEKPTPQPATYELLINGESFMIEADRLVKLSSTRNPGVKYEVALRLSPLQRGVTNHFEFQYDARSQLDDDGGNDQRTVNLRHELGFSILLTDLGAAAPVGGAEGLLNKYVASTLSTYRESGMTDVEVSPAADYPLENLAARAVRIHYRDKHRFDHTCALLVLNRENLWAVCVVQYLDRDINDGGPLVKRILNSLRLLPATTPR